MAYYRRGGGGLIIGILRYTREYDFFSFKKGLGWFTTVLP